MMRWVWGFITLTIWSWIVGLWWVPPPMNGRAWTHEVFFVTGVLAWGLMAICLVIACRPSWLEQLTKTPLDALYVSHRILGWWALGLSFLHYFTKEWFLPLISVLSLPKPEKVVPVGNPDLFTSIWQSLRPIANLSAEWLTWIMGLICVLALMRALGYTRWLTFHRLLSVVFLGLTLHCIRLMDPTDFLTPFGWINITVTVVGSWAAITLLIWGPGRHALYSGLLTHSRTQGNVTYWTIKTPVARWVHPGQFVFIKLNGEAHPFSVASSNYRQIQLVIRHLGDFTTHVIPKIATGEQLCIEGPYGRFFPIFDGRSQTWIAAGMGIAPFLAWINSATPITAQDVTLHWCVRDAEQEPLMSDVVKACEETGVTLKIHESRKSRVTAQTLLEDGSDRLAVCGGAELAKSLRKAWKGKASHFQEEHFSWRHSN